MVHEIGDEGPAKNENCLRLGVFNGQHQLGRVLGGLELAHAAVADGGAQVEIDQGVKKGGVRLLELRGQARVFKLLDRLRK